MDLTTIEAGPAVPVLGGLLLLITLDTLLGALSAFQGGTFKWEYLYAVALTKGAAMARIGLLFLAGMLTPAIDLSLLGLEVNPFSTGALALATPLAASTLASIWDNVGKSDLTAPQGVAPVGQPTPPDKV